MKKTLVVFMMVFVMIFAVSCGGAKTEKKVLNVYNWGDYMDLDTVKKFTEKTGIEVVYEDFITNEDMYVKIKNGSENYDVVIPSDYMIKKMIDEDMLQKVDMTKIPNYKNIGESYKNLEYDPKNEYSIPYFWGTVGILYNKTMVKEPVDSWSILFDEKYAGKVFMLDSQRDTLMVALKYLGYSMNSVNPKEIEEARDLLIKQKPNVLAYGVDNIKNDMVNNAAALMPTYNGEAIALGEQNENLGYALPKEGTNLWFDAMVIPKNAEHSEAAHEFINFMLEPEVGAKNTEFVGYSTPNTEAYKLLDKELQENEEAYPDVSKIKNWEVFIDLGKNIELYNDAWTQIKAQ